MGWQLRLDWKCSLTVGINRWLCITDTIQTMICVSTVSTTVTSIKVAICIVHFIIAETIRYQFLWTITVLWIAYTVSTKLCVDIRSTTITSIKIAFLVIQLIFTITISYITRGLTALTIRIEYSVFQLILSKQINNLQSNTPSTEQEQKGPGAASLVIFSPTHLHSEQSRVLTSGPQQSPPPNTQPALLFSSSHPPVQILSGIGLEQAGIQTQI